MKTLTIFYDSNCGLCINFKRWLSAQQSDLALRFLPYNSDQARACLPIIDNLNAGDKIVVMADDGRWWQGPSAWLTCLWALKNYREWSFRLANPVLLPLVEKLCHSLSENRLQISQLLKLEPTRLKKIVTNTIPPCHSEQCRPTALSQAKKEAKGSLSSHP